MLWLVEPETFQVEGVSRNRGWHRKELDSEEDSTWTMGREVVQIHSVWDSPTDDERASRDGFCIDITKKDGISDDGAGQTWANRQLQSPRIAANRPCGSAHLENSYGVSPP